MEQEFKSARDFSNEFIFNTSRSGGPGGQNVNKVSSKVELRFNIVDSKSLNDSEKELLLLKAATKITSEGVLRIVSQSSRSQLDNKENCILKFYQLLEKALKPVKPRKTKKRSRAWHEKRLREKQHTSEIKELRKKVID